MIRNRLFAVSLIVGTSFAFRPLHAQGPAEEAIRKALADQAVAINKNDGPGVASFYTNEVIVIDGGEIVRGHAAWQAWLTKAYAGEYKGVKVSFAVTAIRFLKPDVALVLGVETANMPNQPALKGNLLAVFAKRGGHWLIDGVHSAEAPTKK